MVHTVEGLLIRLRSGEQITLRVPDQESLEDIVATLEDGCRPGAAVKGFRPSGNFVVVPGSAVEYTEVVLAARARG
jgi:hypothetical protein